MSDARNIRSRFLHAAAGWFYRADFRLRILEYGLLGEHGQCHPRRRSAPYITTIRPWAFPVNSAFQWTNLPRALEDLAQTARGARVRLGMKH